jgi:hypothetical protein
MAYTSATRVSEDFEILDNDGSEFGTIRVKPSGVLWSPKRKHDWVGVDIREFAELMEKYGWFWERSLPAFGAEQRRKPKKGI